VETALQQLKKTGFVNYYGMQRFGTGDVPTHWVSFYLSIPYSIAWPSQDPTNNVDGKIIDR
jgi:hypothetical protein